MHSKGRMITNEPGGGRGLEGGDKGQVETDNCETRMDLAWSIVHLFITNVNITQECPFRHYQQLPSITTGGANTSNVYTNLYTSFWKSFYPSGAHHGEEGCILVVSLFGPLVYLCVYLLRWLRTQPWGELVLRVCEFINITPMWWLVYDVSTKTFV